MKNFFVFLALVPSVGDAEIYTQKLVSYSFDSSFVVEGVCSTGGQNVYLRRPLVHSSLASDNWLSFVVCRKNYVAGGYKISFIRGSAPFTHANDPSPRNVLIGCTMEGGRPVEFTYEWADFGNVHHPALMGDPEDNLVLVQHTPDRIRSLHNRNNKKEINVVWEDKFGNIGSETLSPQDGVMTVHYERVTAAWFTRPYRPDACGDDQ